MPNNFQIELDELITKHKPTTDLDEMVADMKGAVEGLEAEINDESED